MVPQAPVVVEERSYDRAILSTHHGEVKFAYLPHPQTARTLHMQNVFSTMLSTKSNLHDLEEI